MHTNQDAVFLPPAGCRSGHQTVIRLLWSNSLAPLLIRVHGCSFVVSCCLARLYSCYNRAKASRVARNLRTSGFNAGGRGGTTGSRRPLREPLRPLRLTGIGSLVAAVPRWVNPEHRNGFPLNTLKSAKAAPWKGKSATEGFFRGLVLQLLPFSRSFACFAGTTSEFVSIRG